MKQDSIDQITKRVEQIDNENISLQMRVKELNTALKKVTIRVENLQKEVEKLILKLKLKEVEEMKLRSKFMMSIINVLVAFITAMALTVNTEAKYMTMTWKMKERGLCITTQNPQNNPITAPISTLISTPIIKVEVQLYFRVPVSKRSW